MSTALVAAALLAGTSVTAWGRPPPTAPAWAQKRSEGLTPGSERSVNLQNGSFQHEVPIEVPKFHGLEPELKLEYNSSAGNGFLGLGWSFDGFSVIERVGPNGQGSRSCTATDTYTLDGAPLVACTALGGTHCAKDQTFLRIDFDARNDRWEVREKDGTKSTYEKIFDVAGAAGGTSCPARYGLASREDRSGNRVTYGWRTDSASGASQKEVYPSTIAYNGVTITLYPEERPDVVAYANGVDVSRQRQRLRSILVTVDSAGAAGNGIDTPLRAYKLGYGASTTTGRSRLTSVSEHGRDVVIDAAGAITGGVVLRRLTFAYAGGTAAFDHAVSWSGFSDENGYKDVSNYATIRTADIDGDGRTDVCARANSGIYCYRYHGEGWSNFANIRGTPAWSDAAGWNKPEHYTTIQFPDLNGDGKADLCGRADNGLNCWLNNGAASPAFTTSVPPPVTAEGKNYFSDEVGWNQEKYYASLRFADVNGDGKDDVCGRGASGVYCRLMNAAGRGWGSYVEGPEWTNDAHWDDPENYRTIQFPDLNGDGMADVCGRSNDGIRCAMSLGTAFGPSWNGPAWTDAAGWTAAKFYSTIQFPDINGDGMADVCGRASDGMRCHLAMGSARGGDRVAFAPTAITDTTLSDANGYGAAKFYETIQLADINADGKADLCWRAAAGIYCSRSTGTSFVRVISASPAWSDASGWGEVDNYSTIRWVDLDGDGKADLFGRGTGGLRIFESHADGPERMSALTNNGAGGSIAITYAPSSAFPRQNNPPIDHVVKTLAVSDGRGQTSTFTFEYEGERYDRANQRSLGFRYVKRVQPPIAGEAAPPFEELWFMQAPYACVGEIDHEKRWSGEGRLLTFTERSYEAAGAGAGPYTCQLDVVSEHQYDASGNSTCTAVDNTHCKRTDIAYDYDAFGNVVVTYDYGDFFSAEDDTTTAITYNQVPNVYLVDAPARTRTYAGIGTTGTMLTELLTFYDGAQSLTEAPTRGLPTMQHTWVSNVGGSANAPAYVTTRRGYDGFGNEIWSEDGLGQRTRHVYDPVYHLYPIETTNPRGHVETTTWDTVCGLPLAEVDPNGETASFVYDDFCRLVRRSDPLGGFEVHVYSPLGNAAAQYERVEAPPTAGMPGNAYRMRWFDGLGRTYRTVETGPDAAAADDIVVDTSFDVRGNVRTRSLPRYEGARAEVTTFDYDALDRPIQVTHADGAFATTRYELWTTITTDEAGRQTARTVDADERFVALAEKDATGWITATTTYDRLGNPIYTVDPAGNATRRVYNSLGQMLAEDDPDRGAWSYTYDANGRLETATDPRGRIIRTGYDELGRVSRRTVDAGGSAPQVTTYGYDEERTGFANIGQLTSMTDPEGTATYDHDAAGRVVVETRSVRGTVHTFQRWFDAGDRLVATRYPDGELVGDDPATAAVEPGIAYDGAGRLKAIPGVVNEVSYSAGGGVVRLVNANGTVSTRSYSPQRDWLDSMKLTRGGVVLQDLAYSRDREGKIIGISSPRAGDRWTYGYDELGRLRTAQAADRPQEPHAWTYDKTGNMLTSSSLGSYMYPRPGAPQPHAPLAAGGKAFEYDELGHMISGNGRRYTWDAAGRLVTVTAGASVTTYAYDGDGERLEKVHDGVTTLYLGEDVEIGPGGVTKYFRVGPELVAKKVGARRFWLHPNHVDSVAIVTDESGAEVKRTVQAPYGEMLESTGEHEESFGFTGQRQDENELVYMHARYYDPALGLFLSPDPVTPEGRVVGLNRYAYAFNDPINFTDPTGHVPWSKIGKFVTVAAVGIAATAACGPGCGILAAAVVGTAWDAGNAAYHGKMKDYNLVQNAAENTFDATVGALTGRIPIFRNATGSVTRRARELFKPTHRSKPRWGDLTKSQRRNATDATRRQHALDRRNWVEKRRKWNDPDHLHRIETRIEGGFTAIPGEAGSNTIKAGIEAAPGGARWVHERWRPRPTPRRKPVQYCPCLPPKPKPAPRPRRGGCFVAGTPVAMADGSQKAIDQIRVGDVVLAFDEITQAVVPSPVTELFVHENWEREARTVLVNGHLRATDNHPFFVNGEWRRADELEAGDWLFTLPAASAAGAAVVPEAATELMMLPGVGTVYNLEVATYHTYFAGGVLVHNMKSVH